jgi:hypothetical protein
MFKPFLKQLTKVTDLTILFASIFVFLAFITPEELSQVPLNNARDNYDKTASSLALAESKVISSRIELEESISISNELRNSIAAAENEINSIDTDFVESVINDIDTNTDPDLTNQTDTDPDLTNQADTELDQLNTELVANESQSKLFRETAEEASKNVVLLQNQLNMIVKTIADIETAALSSRAIPWIQPVRKNTNELVHAAGFDGFIAGFAALIFCLVCKRRGTWFKQMFGIYFK